MEDAWFITNEDGDDLIVSFVIPTDESERGVKVSFEDFPDDRHELLKKLTIEGNMVTITTDYGIHTVNVEDVDQMEIQEAKKILKKINFDGRFELTVV